MSKPDPQTMPTIEEKRQFVMDNMPNTGHLVVDDVIDAFYNNCKSYPLKKFMEDHDGSN